MGVVPDLLSHGLKLGPGRPCITQGEVTLTFAQVDDRAARAAAALAAAGIEEGDRIAVLALNDLPYLELQVAAQRLGAILVPLNFRLTSHELDKHLKDATPAILLHGAEFEDVVGGLPVPRTWNLADVGPDGYEQRIAAHDPTHRATSVPADRPVMIVYTSGTTGQPKGATVSNGVLLSRMTMFALEFGMTSDDVFVMAAPMFHITSNFSYAFTLVGAHVVFSRRFDPSELIGLIERYQATQTVLAPTLINLMTRMPELEEADISSLRLVTYGGSPIAPDVLRAALPAFGCSFMQIFGMTETTGISFLRPDDHEPDQHPERLGSAGKDALTVEVRIVDEEDRELPQGEVGEIITRSPNVMLGYWNDEETTAQVLRGGWMHTGDVGLRTADGYLVITDRVKDMIVSGGENVYPREIEDVLYAHPAVVEVAVIGIPDDRWGEAVHATLVLEAGSTVTEDDIRSYCRERLAGYKVPKSVSFLEEMPKSAVGKILKRELRAPYWSDQDRQVG